MEKNNQAKAERFVSTFTQNPQQFDTFTTTLQEVLHGEDKIQELKSSAKETESLVIGWIDFCEELGFYAFHTYLLDAFEQWQSVIRYIKSMSSETKTKNIKDLKILRMQSNQNINIPKAINVCYTMQSEITQLLAQQDKTVVVNQSTTKNDWGKELLGGVDDFFGPDDFIDKIIDEQDEQKFYNDFVAAVNKTYHFTSNGIPVRKSSLRSIKERFGEGKKDLRE